MSDIILRHAIALTQSFVLPTDFINQCYSGLVYSTVRYYVRSSGMAMVDFTAIHKLARTFDVMIENLVEIWQE